MKALVNAVQEIVDNRSKDYLHIDDRDMLKSALPVEASPELRAAAVRIYGSDEVEIDDTAYTSEAEGGTWVSAWVWVSDEDQVR